MIFLCEAVKSIIYVFIHTSCKHFLNNTLVNATSGKSFFIIIFSSFVLSLVIKLTNLLSVSDIFSIWYFEDSKILVNPFLLIIKKSS